MLCWKHKSWNHWESYRVLGASKFQTSLPKETGCLYRPTGRSDFLNMTGLLDVSVRFQCVPESWEGTKFSQLVNQMFLFIKHFLVKKLVWGAVEEPTGEVSEIYIVLYIYIHIYIHNIYIYV